ncbi:MAG: PAS domain S-box protein [Cyclobacteriaceae bacterium]
MRRVISEIHMMFSLDINLEYSGFNSAYEKWVYDHHKTKIKIGDPWPGFPVDHKKIEGETKSKFLKYLNGDDAALSDTQEHLIYGDTMTCTCNMKSWDKDGKVAGLSFSLIDSPELQRLSYSKSEVLNLELVAENVQNSVVICDAKRKVQYVNPGFVRVTGYTFDEVRGRTLSFLQGKDTNPLHIEEMKKALQDQVSFSIEILNYRKSGEPFWSEIYVTPYFDQHGKLSKFIGIQNDISKRKEYENLLRKNEAQYWSIINSLHEGVVVQSLNDTIMLANDSAGKILGLSRKQLLGKDSYDSRWKALNMDGTELKAEEHPSMVTLRTGKPVTNFLMNVHVGNKKRRVISINSELVKDENGDVFGVVASFLDVTKQIETQQELKDSEERYKLLVENAPVGILLHIDGKIKIRNSYAAKVLEEDKKASLINKPLLDIIHPDFRTIVAERYKHLSIGKEKNIEALEEKLLTLNNKTIDVLKSGIPVTYKGEPSFLTVFSDITKIKESEDMLKANQEKISNLTNSVPGVVLQYKLNPDGSDEIPFISEGVLDLFGVSKEEALGDVMNVWGIIYPDDIPGIQQSISDSARDMTFWNHICRARTKEGEIRWINGRGFPYKHEDGSITWDSLILDITELKETQFQLEEINRQLELAVNAAKLGVWTYDIQKKEYHWNDIVYEIYNVPKKDTPPEPDSWTKKLHPEDAKSVLDVFIGMQAGKTVHGLQYRIQPKEDSIRHIQASGAALRDHAGNVYKLVGIDMDITDFVEKEKALEHALEQKNTLLKELHHRIKNNLNLISSLLYFKSKATKDQALLDYIKETKTRINTIAKTHDQLLKMEEFDRLDVKKYLEDLIMNLIATYTTDGSKFPLTLNLESHKLSVDKILVLGLLTNEIILNTIKYAYEPGVGGPIFVTLKQAKESMQLTIFDKGKGIDKKQKGKGITSGLDLINLLVQQLNGTMNMNAQQGVKYIIEFSMQE